MSKKLRARIVWLEELLEKSLKVIKSLEKKNEEIEADRRNLIDWYWRAQDLLKEKVEMQREIDSLKTSNKALLEALVEMGYQKNKKVKTVKELSCEINRIKKEAEKKESVIEGEKCEEIKEREELKANIRRLINDKLKKRSFDVKA